MPDTDRPGHHEDEPIVITNEELISRIKNLTVMTRILLFLVVAALALPPIFGLRKPKSTFVPAERATVVALQGRIAQQANLLAYIKDHTDTTGVNDLRQRINELNTSIEQRSTDVDQLRRDVNHLQIHGTQ